MSLVVGGFWGSSRSNGLDKAAPLGEVGRFQLTSGQYTVLIKDGRNAKDMQYLPGLFKIDTATGQVWRYMETIDPSVHGGGEAMWINMTGGLVKKIEPVEKPGKTP